MKLIGLILVLAFFVAANTNPNVIQTTEITPNHVPNEHPVSKDIVIDKKEHHPATKQQHIQPVQKKREHKHELGKQQHHNNNNIKEQQPTQIHHAVNDKHAVKEHKHTQHKNSLMQYKNISKQRLAVQQHQDIEHHKGPQHHVSQQHHSGQAEQKAQNHKRHHAHRHMLLKSDSVYKLRNTDLDVEGFENEIVGMLKGIELGKINATTIVVLNRYVDVIFDYLRHIIIKQELNTVPLSKETVKVKHAGHCDLNHGTLKDIATIYRTNNVFISYNPSEKKVTLGFPFKFNDLKINYDFQVKSRLFKTHGGVNGFIKNVQFNPVFSYYYKSDKLTLDHFDMKNTGQLTVKFSGHKIVDWIINPISKAFTHIFHHKIVNTLQSHVSSAIHKGIGKLNQNIAKKMHKNTL